MRHLTLAEVLQGPEESHDQIGRLRGGGLI